MKTIKKINKIADAFVKKFWKECKEESKTFKEIKEKITDDDIHRIVVEYFSNTKLSEANKKMRSAFEEYFPDTSEEVDWDLSEEDRKASPEYKQMRIHLDVMSCQYAAVRHVDLEKKFVEFNGYAHTNQEAAELAANKWCELLFDWHLQDNGAINEDHAGGFYACALGTVLANKSKERITDEMKTKARDLFIQYYLKYIDYHSCDFNYSTIRDVIDWAEETMPDSSDKERPFNWVNGFSQGSMYCDYSPYMPLYLLLLAAGIPEKDASSICPWKTGIEIRPVDNAVLYRTYRHTEEL